jgi:hypothetical protein
VKLRVPVGLLNVPVKDWCECELNVSVTVKEGRPVGLVKVKLPVGTGGTEKENEESARLARDDAGGGGRLKLPVGLLNVPVKECCGWELNVSVKVKLPVGFGGTEKENEESARLVRDDAGGGGRLKLPVGLLNVPVKECGYLEWELSVGLLKVPVNEKEESARLARDEKGGMLKLPVGLVKLSVKVKDGRPVGFVKVNDGRPVGLVKVKDGNPVKLESARLSATGAAFKRL